MNVVVDSLKDKLRRRQVVGSLRVALETAKVLMIVVRSSRWNSKDELVETVVEKGKVLSEAQPIGLYFLAIYIINTSTTTDNYESELAVGNITNRVVNLIREEDLGLKDTPASEYRDALKTNVIDAIKELMDEVENASANIASQALEHIHSNEIIMTLGRSLAVEAFLKEAAKLRKFQVIVAEASPRYAERSEVNCVCVGENMATEVSEV
ncbi:UNVERIFIED_CONTAM: Translation initiation factor eIF-2B subunit beta [Siphonaria sp. JEL0065]|nr:Translation initiation factor eIF-2B subunit beta [Siphonaria sp. JEL0065]